MTSSTLEKLKLKRPKGRYIVEIRDAKTGKLVDHRVKENYISAGWDRFSQWQHAANMVLPFGVIGDSEWILDTPLTEANVYQGSTPWAFDPSCPPPMGMDALVLTDFAGAESASDEWMRGNVIAAASRWKATVPASGPRGQINEAECTVSSNLRVWTWVWDFTTTQGNGSFQSLHIGAVHVWGDSEAGVYVKPACSWGSRGRILTMANGVITSNPSKASVCVDPDNNDIYFLGSDASPPAVSVYKITDAQWDAASTQDGSGNWALAGNGVKVCDVPSGHLTNSPTHDTQMYYGTLGLVKIPASAGDGFMLIGAIPHTPDEVAVSRFTTGGSSTYAPVLSGIECPDIGDTTFSGVFIGGNVYVAVGRGDASPSYVIDTLSKTYPLNLYRFDDSDGSFDATVSLPSGWKHAGQITTDNTRIFVLCDDGIRIMNVSGSQVSPYNLGLPWVSDPNLLGDYDVDHHETATSPMSGFGKPGYGPKNTPDVRNGRSRIVTLRETTTNSDLASATRLIGSPELLGKSNIEDLMDMDDNGYTWPTLMWRDSRLWVCQSRWSAPANGGPGVDAFGYDGGNNYTRLIVASVDGNNMFSRTRLSSPAEKTSSNTMKITYELTLPDEWWGNAPHGNPLLNA